jgi:transmembrane sensor
MKNKSDKSAFPPEVESAALQWLGWRDAGLITAEKEEEFIAWLGADERHAAAFAEYDRLWSGLDKLGRLKPAGGAPDPDLLMAGAAPAATLRYPLPDARKVKMSWRGWVPLTLAAAAALALGFFLWPRHDEVSTVNLTEHVATTVGEQQTLNLPDGSMIRLNTNTEVTVNFVPRERRIRLVRGEAHFAVAKNKARPFIVAAGKVAVRAVGTAFNVRLESAGVEVLVTDGRVAVAMPEAGSRRPETGDQRSEIGGQLADDRGQATAPLASFFLTVGQKVLIPTEQVAASAAPAVIPMSAPEIDRALAWREQSLEFDSTPLDQVVEEFNRYNRHQLVIVDESLKARRFTGRFRPDGYEALLRLLQHSFGVQVETRGDRTLLSLPADRQ